MLDERSFRALSAGFIATVALFARVAHAVPATPLTIDGYRCTIVGTAGPDLIGGTAGRDVICGLGGDDRIDGQGGNDVLLGGAGADLLEGNLGRDLIYGGPGNDRIDAWDGAPDRLNGGPGRDRAWYDGSMDTRISIEQHG